MKRRCKKLPYGTVYVSAGNLRIERHLNLHKLYEYAHPLFPPLDYRHLKFIYNELSFFRLQHLDIRCLRKFLLLCIDAWRSLNGVDFAGHLNFL